MSASTSKLRRLLAATAAGLALAHGAHAQQQQAVAPPLPTSVSLAQFGLAQGNTAAQNTAAMTAAIAYAVATGAPLFCPAATTPYLIASQINIPAHVTLIGASTTWGASTGTPGCVFEPPTSTAGILLHGTFLNIQNIGVEYASQEAQANTSSVCFTFGNASEYLSESYLNNLACYQARDGFDSGAGSTYGEFQNTFVNLDVFGFTGYGMNLACGAPCGASGSTFINTRLQGVGSASPSSTANAIGGLLMTNYTGFVVDTLNIEAVSPSIALAEFTVAHGVLNSVHLEKDGFVAGTQGIELVAANLVVNDLSLQNSTVFSASVTDLFYNYTGSGAYHNQLALNGFTESTNTFTAKLSFVGQDAASNYNLIHIQGVATTNSGNVVVTSRDSLLQYDQWQFNTPGGVVVAGLSGTAAPSGGMPAPFASTGGTALAWVVGDHEVKTNVTATTSPGWINTTAGSPGTWTAEPVL